MNTVEIKLKDIPDDYINRVQLELSKYSVSLFRRNENGQSMELLGSGTLVECEGVHGIVTAAHVLSKQSPQLVFSQSLEDGLMLPVDGGTNAFMLPYAVLSKMIIGSGDDEEAGPDIAFIRIHDCPQLGTLKAKRCFWNLGHDRTLKKDFAVNRANTAMVVGFPKERERMDSTSFGEPQVRSFCLGLFGPYQQSDTDFDGQFDYICFDTKKSIYSDVPSEFGGMSGGGIWLVESSVQAGTQNFEVQEYVFGGVAFYQRFLEDGVVRIRGHFSASIYGKLYEELTSANNS